MTRRPGNRTASGTGIGWRSPAAVTAAARAAAAADAQAFWEPHYAGMAPSADGVLPRPNPVLVNVADHLAPGEALDLGAGQGGDALWLARHGWDVTAVDVSATALQRLAAHVAEAALSGQVRTEQHDLSVTFPVGTFDLITAQYFHSPIAMDRPAVLARAAAAVRPGGTLLIVDHASVAPWSWADPDMVFPAPEQTLHALELDLAEWDVVACSNRDREAEGPDGQRATVTDTVIALVKREAATASPQ